jgi:hypothetical protein
MSCSDGIIIYLFLSSLFCKNLFRDNTNIIKMACWGYLPLEILTLIFEHVPDLAQVRLTCKRWLASSQELAFNKVIVSQENITSFIVVADISPYRIGDYARILHLCCSKRDGDGGEQGLLVERFSHLFQLCPNIQVFSANEMPDSMWLMLAERIEKGDPWQQLKLVPSPPYVDGRNVLGAESYSKLC